MDWYSIAVISLVLSTAAFIIGFLLGCESVKRELMEVLRAFDYKRDDERISVKVLRSVIRRIIE